MNEELINDLMNYGFTDSLMKEFISVDLSRNGFFRNVSHR